MMQNARPDPGARCGVLNYLFNTPEAKARFTSYLNNIEPRADFFGAMSNYLRNNGIYVKWFDGAEKVSRAGWVGLGADGAASNITFAAGSLLGGVSSIYEWRSDAGNTLMNGGFDNFKNIFNNGTANPIAWDINQLNNEQSMLQPVHVKWLDSKPLYVSVAKWASGVDLLDYKSRVNYGCKLLGYSKQQGCGF